MPIGDNVKKRVIVIVRSENFSKKIFLKNLFDLFVKSCWNNNKQKITERKVACGPGSYKIPSTLLIPSATISFPSCPEKRAENGKLK